MTFFNRFINLIFFVLKYTKRKLIGARNKMIFVILLCWTKFITDSSSDKAANNAASVVRAIMLDEQRKLVLTLNDFVDGMLMLNEQQQQQRQQQQSTQDISSITASTPDWIPVPSRLQQLFLYAIEPYGMALNWYAVRISYFQGD